MLISTSPEVTSKLFELNLATPIFELLANSPEIVSLFPFATVFNPSPAKNSKVPSTCMGISLAAGVLCTNALKILLGRGDVVHAPQGLHFDAYLNKLVKTNRPGGNKHWKQRFMCWYLRRLLAKGDD